MSLGNPYASPHAVSTPAVRAVLQQGVWRDGSLLVVSRGASLPNRCVRCDAPAENRSLVVRLKWHPSWAYLMLLLGLLPYVIVAIAMTKSLDARFGVCRKHARQRQLVMLAAVLGILFGVSMIVVVFTGTLPSGWLILLGMLIILLSLILALVGPRLVTAARVDQDVAWVNGACASYLDRVPEFIN